MTRLIDKLAETSEGGLGYMATMSGSAFLPLGRSQPGARLLGGESPVASPAIRELVKSGAAAVPHLIAHLGDKRPTKITIRHNLMFFNDEYDYNSRTTKAPKGVNRSLFSGQKGRDSHTVTVGDLCFVALGQIVNREFEALRYQPSMIIVVNSPALSEVLRGAIQKEWEDLTPAKHKESLMRDFVDADSEQRRTGACLRLGYYFPGALEPLALRELSKPRYDCFKVEALIRQKLYRTKDTKQRKQLLDIFVAKYGEVARQGILVDLFDDLGIQEADEKGSISPRFKKNERYDARNCLVELFNYPKNVKSEDVPDLDPLGNCTKAGLFDALALFPTNKLDDAVREVFRSTDEDYLASACAKYLIGRGADADIRKYVQQHSKGANQERGQQLTAMLDWLGWTTVHLAASTGDAHRVETLIISGAGVNAQAENGQTPLHVAAQIGYPEVVGTLLKHKANPNLRDREGRMPVQLGLGCEPAVEMLLKAGAEITDVLVAGFADRVDLVKEFLKKDKTLVGSRTKTSETALHLAARRGNLKVVEVLLANGADVNACDANDFMPLHRAAMCGHTRVVSLLLQHKADAKARTAENMTALEYARYARYEDVVKLLSK